MKPYYSDDSVTLYLGDALTVARELPSGAADCIVTSPPYYGLRDYGVSGQYGLEASPAEYVETMRVLFSELRRVLADDGTLWLNLGDSYSNPSGSGAQGKTGARVARAYTAAYAGGRATDLPPKNLLLIPPRVAMALQADGWILRSEIIWHKVNAMPESVRDRPSKRHEKVFLFSKSDSYWFDLDPIRDAPPGEFLPSGMRNSRYGLPGGRKPSEIRESVAVVNVELGRNPGDVWSIPTTQFAEAHFAVMAPALAERCVQTGCRPGGMVLDPFSGSGTTGLAAAKHGRRYIGIDLNAEYLDLSLRTRLRQPGLDFGEVRDGA